jgi:Asp-tRNA(Asn)/Glu-tRNA(Gln) amidotransferase A subunit family amidase
MSRSVRQQRDHAWARAAVSLPLLTVGGLSIGLQILGIRDCDADLIAVSRWISQSVPKSDF